MDLNRPKFDVLMQADAFCDLVFAFAHGDRLPDLGQEVFADAFSMNPGGAFNIASALTRLEMRVGWSTVLGDDLFSCFIAESMEKVGLSGELTTRVCGHMPILTAAISFPHDRAFISYANPTLGRAAVQGLTAAHLDQYGPRALFTHGEVDVELMEEARERGILVYLDTSWVPERLCPACICPLLEHTDVFCPNLPEALMITGAEDAHGALDTLSDWCSRGAIKLGAKGCIGWDGAGRYALPAIPVRAIETTGAGDNFNAGVIYGLLHGHEFEQCLACGNIAGGLSTTHLGGGVTDISVVEMEAWLSRLDGGRREWTA